MIFFKAEANHNIGAGHLQRCISIAEECVNQGENVTFIFSETHPTYIQKVKDNGYSVRTILPELQLESSSYLQFATNGSLIIFDTDNPNFYSGELVNQLRKSGIKTACFTITDSYRITTDILINPNIASQTHIYDTPKPTVQLLGPKFMILAPCFRNSPILINNSVGYNSILLFFGNADKESLTLVFLEMIFKLNHQFQKINVVVGSLNPKASQIKTRLLELNDPKYTYHFNTPEIKKLYQKTDVAITSAGMSMWEMALYNIPQIVVASSKREMMYTKYLDELNFIHLLSDFKSIKKNTIKKLDFILNNAELDKIDKEAFRMVINPNGITEMVSTFVAFISK